MNSLRAVLRWLLIILGWMTVGYCLWVMWYVSISPDPGLRTLMIDDETIEAHRREQSLDGIILQRVYPGSTLGERPAPGDRLLEFMTTRPRHGLDFYRSLLKLRVPDSQLPPPELVELPVDASLPTNGMPPAELTGGQRAPFFVDQHQRRWVRVVWQPATPPRTESGVSAAGESPRIRESWLEVRPMPVADVLLTLVWFFLELAIFAVGGWAFWSRPHDRAARVFYVMCLTTLGAFVGGFHWWVLAGRLWTILPFAIAAMLVPAVTLHFFLVYPRPKAIFERAPRRVLTLLYAAPVIAITCFLLAEISLWTMDSSRTADDVALQVRWLSWLRLGIYSYVAVAALYFVGVLIALVSSVVTTRNPIERNQVLWILWAGLIASGFIGYSLTAAMFSRAEFALGGIRLPMFAASLVFMIAYAVGISRYKLMLHETVAARGIAYYVLHAAAVSLTALFIAAIVLAAGQADRQPEGLQQWNVLAILATVVGLVIWLRERWQKWIDRRFLRDRYQVDKALQRVNQAVGGLADAQDLAGRLVSSCREVLQADHVAFYHYDRATQAYRLLAIDGGPARPPLTWNPPETLRSLLQPDAPLPAAVLAGEARAAAADVSAEYLLGLGTTSETAGCVVVGTRQSGAVYGAEDLAFLAAMAQIATVALHCAKIHQDLGRLHEELGTKAERISQQKQQILVLQSELAAGQRVGQDEAPVTRAADFQHHAIRGQSPGLQAVLDVARKASASDTTVLIRGESGTGKELLCRAIHENSNRRDHPLIAVHCAALATGLLESELFGHVKGAFTGATSDKVGRFQLADGGTLFLDEIGDVPLETQVKLLRVLQEREIEPVGSHRRVPVNVRIVAATHRPLEQLIVSGQFREDLYYRLNVISIELPPLRERREDLVELLLFYLKQSAEKTGKWVTHFDDDALDRLLRYSWPGNIRELSNVVERAVVLADQNSIRLVDLPQQVLDAPTTSPTTRGEAIGDLLPLRLPGPVSTRPGGNRVASGGVSAGPRSAPAIGPRGADPPRLTNWRPAGGELGSGAGEQAEERRQLVEALRACGGNKAQAARLLGLPRSTFFSKLKKHELTDARE